MVADLLLLSDVLLTDYSFQMNPSFSAADFYTEIQPVPCSAIGWLAVLVAVVYSGL
jgi:hypothetical protein